MDEFKKRYPNLAKELEGGYITINSVRTMDKEAEKAFRARLEGYDPTVIDFLRRCDTEEQGIEIIGFMKRRGEISAQYADKLRFQLIQKGIRSFGPKKERGHYYNEG
jgi:hypothetical protein